MIVSDFNSFYLINPEGFKIRVFFTFDIKQYKSILNHSGNNNFSACNKDPNMLLPIRTLPTLVILQCVLQSIEHLTKMFL